MTVLYPSQLTSQQLLLLATVTTAVGDGSRLRADRGDNARSAPTGTADLVGITSRQKATCSREAGLGAITNLQAVQSTGKAHTKGANAADTSSTKATRRAAAWHTSRGNAAVDSFTCGEPTPRWTTTQLRVSSRIIRIENATEATLAVQTRGALSRIRQLIGETDIVRTDPTLAHGVGEASTTVLDRWCQALQVTSRREGGCSMDDIRCGEFASLHAAHTEADSVATSIRQAEPTHEVTGGTTCPELQLGAAHTVHDEMRFAPSQYNVLVRELPDHACGEWAAGQLDGRVERCLSGASARHGSVDEVAVATQAIAVSQDQRSRVTDELGRRGAWFTEDVIGIARLDQASGASWSTRECDLGNGIPDETTRRENGHQPRDNEGSRRGSVGEVAAWIRG